MNVYLLDAGGAGLIYYFFGAVIIFMIICVLLEAGVMMAMKYTTVFKKAFRDSLSVNLVSLVIGFLLINSALFESYDVLRMAALYGITLAVEFVILYSFNTKIPPGKTFVVCLLMNIPSYIVLYIVYNS